MLITIYIFTPFFARELVGDIVRGQSMVANISMTCGLVTALTAPLLGAVIERSGRRKPVLFTLMLLMAPLLGILWFADPGGAGLSVGATAGVLVALGIVFNWGDVINNSLLPHAALRAQAPVLSGLGYGLASIISVALLVFMLWGFVLPGTVTWSFVPQMPLFGLDRAAGEPSRIAGPLCAIVLLVGSIPFYLWTRDAPPTATPLKPAQLLRAGTASFITTISRLRGQRDVSLFLLFRMLYCDGMMALLIFGGLFAAGAMQWDAMEMLAFGISQSLFAALGGLTAPMMDRAMGSRRAVQLQIALAIVALAAMLGMRHDRILYVWTYDAAGPPVLWHGPLFTTLPELVFLVIGWCLAIFVTAQNASSRALLVQLAPADRIGAFFGLYAMSGTATLWLGSLLVGIGTRMFDSQIGGFIPVIGLLAAGLVGLSFVNDRISPDHPV